MFMFFLKCNIYNFSGFFMPAGTLIYIRWCIGLTAPPTYLSYTGARQKLGVGYQSPCSFRSIATPQRMFTLLYTYISRLYQAVGHQCIIYTYAMVMMELT